MAATIIDNGSAGFSVSGSWNTYNLANSNQYGGNYHYASAGTGGKIAYWQFSGLTTGSYQISACWVAFNSHASNSTYRVYLNGSQQFSATVNQTANPASDVIHSGSAFQHLNTTGLSITTGDTLVVQLDDNANAIVIADAIAVDVLASSSSSTPTAGTQVYPFRQWVEDDFGGGSGGGNVIVIED